MDQAPTVQENGEDNPNKVDMPDPSEPSGFQKGLDPEEILGATEMMGRILFLIKWYGYWTIKELYMHSLLLLCVSV